MLRALLKKLKMGRRVTSIEPARIEIFCFFVTNGSSLVHTIRPLNIVVFPRLGRASVIKTALFLRSKRFCENQTPSLQSRTRNIQRLFTYQSRSNITTKIVKMTNQFLVLALLMVSAVYAVDHEALMAAAEVCYDEW